MGSFFIRGQTKRASRNAESDARISLEERELRPGQYGEIDSLAPACSASCLPVLVAAPSLAPFFDFAQE